jgi:hypothetical protein
MAIPKDIDEKASSLYGVEEHEVGTPVTAAVRASDRTEAEWAGFDRKLILKLDLLLIPLVTMVYLLAFLDRANIGNARVVSISLLTSEAPVSN